MPTGEGLEILIKQAVQQEKEEARQNVAAQEEVLQAIPEDDESQLTES